MCQFDEIRCFTWFWLFLGFIVTAIISNCIAKEWDKVMREEEDLEEKK